MDPIPGKIEGGRSGGTCFGRWVTVVTPIGRQPVWLIEARCLANRGDKSGQFGWKGLAQGPSINMRL